MTILACLLGYAGIGFSQQDYHFTQFNFNKLALNPAYAGSRDVVSITSIYRNQWVNVKGSPKSVTLSMHSPFLNNKIAGGLFFFNDRLGVTNNTGIYGAYAYRLLMKSSTLSIGLQAGMLNVRNNYTELDPNDQGDNLLQENVSHTYPNFGFGAYWSNNRAFAGASFPHLLKNDLNPDNGTDVNRYDQLLRHFYFMGGYVFDLTEKVKIRPSVLLKLVADNNTGSPINMDFNLSFLFINKIWAGVAYRLNDSFDVMMEYQINQQLMAGYAYDFTLTDIRKFTSGSHEIMLRYEFNFRKKSVVTPRYIKYF